MGTLKEQDPRNFRHIKYSDIVDFITEAKSIAKDEDISLELVFEAYRIKEVERRNNLFVDNGNIFDEQMAGFGGLLESLIAHFNVISTVLDDRFHMK